MKIAVVGSGISGLGAAYLLQQKYEVHLFESENRLGGHAHTSFIVDSAQNKIPVDTGFLVLNPETYPHLCGLFDHLKIETCNSDMSLSIRSFEDQIEWAGDNLKTVFAQKKNILNPQFLYMLWEIIKLHNNAKVYQTECENSSLSIDEFLNLKKFRSKIKDWYIYPMLAAIWSTSEKKMKSFPARTFFNFFNNHKLLQVENRPVWKTVNQGSIQYVQAIAQKLKHIYLEEPVISAQKVNSQIKLVTSKSEHFFDKVVLATHAPITRKILGGQWPELDQWLSNFRTHPNKARLHRDSNSMPQNRNCWSSWNVIGHPQENDKAASLTYFLNRLQPLKTNDSFFLSLNPETANNHILFETTYYHPEFDEKAVKAQFEIGKYQGENGFYFAGAWTRYGFHEDGLLSAVQVAQMLNCTPPWENKSRL